MRRNAKAFVVVRGREQPLPLSRGAGLDRITNQAAEDSGSNRAEFQVDLQVRGPHFPLLLCMTMKKSKSCNGHPWTKIKSNFFSLMHPGRSLEDSPA